MQGIWMGMDGWGWLAEHQAVICVHPVHSRLKSIGRPGGDPVAMVARAFYEIS
jgi:hypothetical protein